MDWPTGKKYLVPEGQCFEICKSVRESFDACTSDFNSSANIISLFFHDIVSHFTGLVIHRAAAQEYHGALKFPWVNKRYSQQPFRFSSQQFDNLPSEDSVRLFLKKVSILPVASGNSIPFGYKEKQLARHMLNVVLGYQNDVKVYLCQHALQVEFLRSLIYQLCREMEINDPDIVWGNWQRHITEHTSSQREPNFSRGVILGTRNDLLNRKLAINFLNESKPVVGFTHGEITNNVYDEPVYGYSDKTLCTTLVDYGVFSPQSENHPPILKPERTIRRHSSVIKRRFRRESRIHQHSIYQSKVLFIPTIYQENALYGPRHAYEAAIYQKWHMEVARVIPNMTLKLHPKNRFSPTRYCATECRRLEECIDDYDLLIFDFFATGAVIAIYSDKPVIYFDIGLRSLAPEFAAVLRQRCFVVQIDFSAPYCWEEQIRLGVMRYEQEYRDQSYENLEQFSLCENNELRFGELVLDIIEGRK